MWVLDILGVLTKLDYWIIFVFWNDLLSRPFSRFLILGDYILSLMVVLRGPLWCFGVAVFASG